MTSKFLSASEFFKSVAKTVYLYKDIWKEKTTTLLHTPRETDKTGMAIDIAKSRREGVYLACEQRIYDHAARLVKAPEHLSISCRLFSMKVVYRSLTLSTRLVSPCAS